MMGCFIQEDFFFFLVDICNLLYGFSSFLFFGFTSDLWHMEAYEARRELRLWDKCFSFHS